MTFLLAIAWAGPAMTCPDDMVFIDEGEHSFCIDRYEAHLEGWDPTAVPDEQQAFVAVNEEGLLPQAYISADMAEAACENAGKRLCYPDEWERACTGPKATRFPYGDEYQPGACNEGRASHPVLELYGRAANWRLQQMNDPLLNLLPDTLAPAGTFPTCVTPEGVHDLHGNLHEWVDDPRGTFRGGFYVDAHRNGAGCSYQTEAHPTDYHDYSTGFRCCAEAELIADGDGLVTGDQ
jgi:sulfatase modifying factor 1